jgi:hypothetical protein
MPDYKVLVTAEGLNIPQLDNPAEPPACGFYVWRCVEAPTVEIARERAVALVCCDPKVSRFINDSVSGQPHVFAERAEEIADGDYRPTTGFIFFQ